MAESIPPPTSSDLAIDLAEEYATSQRWSHWMAKSLLAREQALTRRCAAAEAGRDRMRAALTQFVHMDEQDCEVSGGQWCAAMVMARAALKGE